MTPALVASRLSNASPIGSASCATAVWWPATGPAPCPGISWCGRWWGATYLAFSEQWVEIEEIHLKVTGEGHTVEDPAGRKVRCALRWKDRAALEEQIAARLTRGW